MKKIYGLFTLGLVVMFAVGFLVGRIVYHQPSKELCIGIPVAHNPGTFEFDEKMCISNLNPDDEMMLDDVRLMVASATPIEDGLAPSDLPDYMIRLQSLKFGVAFIMQQVWLTDDGAIIGDWNYETNTMTDAKQLSQDDTDYLIEIMNLIKSK